MTFILLMSAYVALALLFYLRIRVETLKWIFANEWNGSCVKIIRTVLFGRVDVKKFKSTYMNDEKTEKSDLDAV